MPKLITHGIKMCVVLMLLCVSIPAIAQKNNVTINANNSPLKSVIEQIEKQTDYHFIYNKDMVDLNHLVTLKVTDESLENVLPRLFANSTITFSVEKRQIVLSNKKTSNKDENVHKGINIKVSGVVSDSNGDPLVGVSITSKSMAGGVTTNIDGEYSWEVPSGTIVNFSYVGFDPVSKKVTKDGTVNVIMTENSQLLNEVVVTGYGATTRKNLTTSIATVKADKIQKGAMSNVNSMLLGRAAGVQASIASPQPGGGINISVRGGGTPVYVIDGVVMPSTALEGSSGNTNLPGSTNRTNLQDLNPNDIESIEILKDASAAIYGIGAANGVILITTKKGQEGKPRVTYEGNVSWSKNYKYTEMLTGAEQMNMINLWSKENYLYDRSQYPYGNLAYDGNWTPYFTQEQIANAINHNWLDDEFKTGFISNHNITVNGGNEWVRYYLGLNYYKEDATVRNSDMERYTLRTNVQTKLTNFMRLTTIVNLNKNTYNNSTNGADNGNLDRQGSGAVYSAMVYPAYMPTYDENGNYTQFVNVPNPVALRNILDKTVNTSWNANFSLDIDIIKNMLSLRGVYGAFQENGERDSYIPSDVYFGLQRKSRGAVASNQREYTTLEGFVNFNHKFGSLVDISAMAGMGEYITSGHGFVISYENANDHLTSESIEKAEGPFYPSSHKYKNKKRSQFFRATFDFLDRYVLSGSLRRDGTDKFFPGKKYSLFPSVSLAWKMHDEVFLRDITWINMLKLRASYGETGEDNLGSSLYGVINTTREDVKFAGNTVTYIPFISVGADYDDVTWQKTVMKNIGLDFSVLHDRLSGSVDIFRNDITNLLGSAPTELLGMYGTRPINGGHFRREGIDVTLNSTNIATKDFRWTTSLTLSHYNAVWVERMPNYDFQPYQKRKNEPTNVAYYYKTYGVVNIDRSNVTDVQRTLGAQASMPGFPLIEDSNGDGKIDILDVNTYNMTPKVYYGLGTSFQYKNFDLDLYFYGQLGVKKINTAYDMSTSSVILPRGADYNNVGKYIYQVWNSQTNYGEGAKFPGLATGKMTMPGNIGFDNLLEDASFLRVRNITLGYNVPLKALGLFKGYLNGVRLYVDCQNPFTFTKYKGVDPEINTRAGSLCGGQIPIARTYTLGLKLTF